jgi:hypothetical protein
MTQLVKNIWRGEQCLCGIAFHKVLKVTRLNLLKERFLELRAAMKDIYLHWTPTNYGVSGFCRYIFMTSTIYSLGSLRREQASVGGLGF